MSRFTEHLWLNKKDKNTHTGLISSELHRKRPVRRTTSTFAVAALSNRATKRPVASAAGYLRACVDVQSGRLSGGRRNCRLGI